MSALAAVPPAARAYGALFRLLLPGLRGNHAEDAVELFTDLYREARRQGRGKVLRLCCASLWRLVLCAARERLEQQRRPRLPAARRTPRRDSGRNGMRSLIQDLRYAARTLSQSPGPTVAAVLTLAVAIGATTTIFSVVDTVVLRPLPYPDPERLIFIDNGNHSPALLRDWQEGAHSFSALGGARARELALSGDGDPEQVAAATVTQDFLPLLGAAPALGRLFAAEEFSGKATAAVLGHGFWVRRFGADPNVLGRTLRLDGQPVVIAGVMSPGFQPPEALIGGRVDVWLPFDLHDPEFQERKWWLLAAVGRLRDGASLAAAREEMERLDEAAAAAYPDWYKNEDGTILTHPLATLAEATVGRVRPTLFLLLGAVGLMMAIAIANVANLQLARGLARSREVGLREALGASRQRIFTQLLTESLCLALLGGGVGAGLAFGGVAAFRAFHPDNIPRLGHLAVDLRVLGFVLLVSALTGILFGLLPALHASRSGLSEVLKEGAKATTVGRKRERLRSALVVGETAVALVLLVGAGLLLRSLVAQLRVEPGFRIDGVTVLQLQLGPTFTADQRREVSAALLEDVRAVPGVEAAAGSLSAPLEFFGGSRCCWRTKVAAGTAPAGDAGVAAFIHPITEGYFATLKIPLLAGRAFERGEREGEARVAVINRQLSQKLFGDRPAVGKELRFGDNSFSIVGVVEGEHHYGLAQAVELGVYIPFAKEATNFDRLRILVRSPLPLEALAPALRRAVWNRAPDQPVSGITTLRQLAERSVAGPEFLSLLLSTFAAVALLLASGGVYATMLYLVGQRRREMGIRLALGASGNSVQRLVLSHGLALMGLGIACGIGGALALSQLLESLLWGVSTTDAPTVAASAALLGLVGLLVCWLPAWKAARTDPMETLRAE